MLTFILHDSLLLLWGKKLQAWCGKTGMGKPRCWCCGTAPYCITSVLYHLKMHASQKWIDRHVWVGSEGLWCVRRDENSLLYTMLVNMIDHEGLPELLNYITSYYRSDKNKNIVYVLYVSLLMSLSYWLLVFNHQWQFSKATALNKDKKKKLISYITLKQHMFLYLENKSFPVAN